MTDPAVNRPLVIAGIEDIFFSAKIEPVARETGVELRVALDAAQLQTALDERLPALIILDLNSKTCGPLDAIRRIKADRRLSSVPLVGFLSHVQAELEAAAREAGCDHVMPRSAFSKNLAKILGQAKA